MNLKSGRNKLLFMDGNESSSDEMKMSLMNKYRETFIDKLTLWDLEELQFYLTKQYDKTSGWNSEYRLKFEFKLKQYFNEEIIRREIASIETLLGSCNLRISKSKPLCATMLWLHFHKSDLKIWV